jgi:transposase
VRRLAKDSVGRSERLEQRERWVLCCRKNESLEIELPCMVTTVRVFPSRAVEMAKKYEVRLTEEQRQRLQHLVSSGRAAARLLIHARILLKCDQNAEGWKDEQSAQAFDVGLSTVARVRKRFCEEGLEKALAPKPQPARPQKRILSEAAEAMLLDLANSPAPPGRSAWTLSLLAQRMVELEMVRSISDETVRRVLKRMPLRSVNSDQRSAM